MSPILSTLFVTFLVYGTSAWPRPEELGNSITEGELLIDLTELGDKIFGLPKNSSGKNLDTWDATSKFNPEETGEYAQGDILFPPGEQRNGLKSESSRWPQGIIPYVIEGRYPQEYHENIKKAIADYHRLTCIRFVPYSGQKDYLAIGNGKTGCWSSVGRIGGRQEVNLQNPGCVTKKGTIIHELMHAAGFLHEQSRFERDNYVSINFQNIKHGEEYNFNKAAKESTNDFGVPYDYSSVMHYSDYAFSTNGKPTIIAKVSGMQLGQREGLSRGDVKKLNAMYGCNKAEPTTGWTNSVWTGA